MNFDTEIIAPCVNPNAAIAGLTDCLDGVDIPSFDERCGDPAFADANPDLCKNFPRLRLKPESATTEPGGNVTYLVFLQTGAKEVAITKGLAWTASAIEIAEINQFGVATGVSPGYCTIGVTWENLSAFARLEVVLECAETETCYLLMIDNSASSSQQFGAAYGSKLAYAKNTARSFISFVNTAKDSFAVGSFNESGDIVLTDGVNAVAAENAVSNIPLTSRKTNIAAAIQDGTAYLDKLSKHKVLILFSDFEDNSGPDPVPIAKAWKSKGNTVVVVALRCWGQFYANAYAVASAGYFLSAYEATGYATANTLVGMKSFLCGGSCSPAAGTFPTAHLDYFGFINWDVVFGNVDLVGLDKWDILPGNGLYVDMAGTDYANRGANARGKIASKVAFTVTTGKQYKLSLHVSGNNRTRPGGGYFEGDYAIQVAFGTYIDQKITVAVPTQDFDDSPNPYSFTFTAGSSGTAKISVECLDQPDGRHPMVGLLIDRVKLENLTDVVTMLYDDFDSENPTTILPGAGYYGCLIVPPGVQVADPTPPPTLAE